MKRILTTLFLAGLITACEKPTPKIEPAAEAPPITETAPPSEPVVKAEPDIRPVLPLGPEGLKYQEALTAHMSQDGFIGAAIAIVDGDTEEFMFHGLADNQTGSNTHMESLFEIGSITKTFTTIILADMVLKGEVGMDDPVADYLPEGIELKAYKDQPITLKHLATHMSGMPRMPYNFMVTDLNNPYANYREDSLYAFLKIYKPTKAPDEEWEYSNLGMGLLGVILAEQAGQSYEELVRDRILTPLGMDNTYIKIPDDKWRDFTKGHHPNGETASYWDIPGLAGAGALRSDIRDMRTYLKANLGLIETPLSEAMTLSHKLQYELKREGDYMGLGWLTFNMEGRSVTWHDGGTGGFRSFLGFDPANKRGVVVLLNSVASPHTIGRAIVTEKPELMQPKGKQKD